MSDKFQDIYRIPSARAVWWNYRNNAAYFVTICSAFREHYFGEIRDEIMYLSEMGKIAHENWYEIPDHFPFVKLGSFVVMPNHVNKPNRRKKLVVLPAKIIPCYPIIYLVQFDGTKEKRRFNVIPFMPVLDGKPGFTITLSAMKNHGKTFRNTY